MASIMGAITLFVVFQRSACRMRAARRLNRPPSPSPNPNLFGGHSRPLRRPLTARESELIVANAFRLCVTLPQTGLSIRNAPASQLTRLLRKTSQKTSQERCKTLGACVTSVLLQSARVHTVRE